MLSMAAAPATRLKRMVEARILEFEEMSVKADYRIEGDLEKKASGLRWVDGANILKPTELRNEGVW